MQELADRCLTSKISSNKNFGVAEWELDFAATTRLNGFLFQEVKLNLAVYKVDRTTDYLLWIVNTNSVPTLEAEAYLLYYTINKV